MNKYIYIYIHILIVKTTTRGRNNICPTLKIMNQTNPMYKYICIHIYIVKTSLRARNGITLQHTAIPCKVLQFTASHRQALHIYIYTYTHTYIYIYIHTHIPYTDDNECKQNHCVHVVKQNWWQRIWQIPLRPRSWFVVMSCIREISHVYIYIHKYLLYICIHTSLRGRNGICHIRCHQFCVVISFVWFVVMSCIFIHYVHAMVSAIHWWQWIKTKLVTTNENTTHDNESNKTNDNKSKNTEYNKVGKPQQHFVAQKKKKGQQVCAQGSPYCHKWRTKKKILDYAQCLLNEGKRSVKTVWEKEKFDYTQAQRRLAHLPQINNLHVCAHVYICKYTFVYIHIQMYTCIYIQLPQINYLQKIRQSFAQKQMYENFSYICMKNEKE